MNRAEIGKMTFCYRQVRKQIVFFEDKEPRLSNLFNPMNQDAASMDAFRAKLASEK